MLNHFSRTQWTSSQPDARWPALVLVSVPAGQSSGTLKHLASWPTTSGRRRKLLGTAGVSLPAPPGQVLTRQGRYSGRGRFGSSGVLKELMLEVAGNPPRQLAQPLHEPLELALEFLTVLRQPIG